MGCCLIEVLEVDQAIAILKHHAVWGDSAESNPKLFRNYFAHERFDGYGRLRGGWHWVNRSLGSQELSPIGLLRRAQKESPEHVIGRIDEWAGLLLKELEDFSVDFDRVLGHGWIIVL